jgi:hypothetical protein
LAFLLHGGMWGGGANAVHLPVVQVEQLGNLVVMREAHYLNKEGQTTLWLRKRGLQHPLGNGSVANISVVLQNSC